jgi:hypothetical protein
LIAFLTLAFCLEAKWLKACALILGETDLNKALSQVLKEGLRHGLKEMKAA